MLHSYTAYNDSGSSSQKGNEILQYIQHHSSQHSSSQSSKPYRRRKKFLPDRLTICLINPGSRLETWTVYTFRYLYLYLSVLTTKKMLIFM